ncbi:hypothetical protein OE88DRAFT_1627384, partial [Heliocybe sulcata]
KILFAGTDESIILRPYNYTDANSSRALPPDLFVTALLRTSGKELPFESFSTWCTTWGSSSTPVCYAESFPSDPSTTRLRFAIKIALNTAGNGLPHPNFVLEEAIFYREHLNELQGRAVPKHYGVWVGTMTWGVTIACAFMEWAGLPYSIARLDKNLVRKDRRAKAMAALLALHKAGFLHNGMDEDTRHILFDKRRERAFVLDFTHVQRHRCHLNMPLKEYSGPPMAHILGCEELWQLGCAIKFFGSGPSLGPEADPEVQKANKKAEDAYFRRKRAQEARERLNASGERNGRPVQGVANDRPTEAAGGNHVQG